MLALARYNLSDSINCVIILAVAHISTQCLLRSYGYQLLHVGRCIWLLEIYGNCTPYTILVALFVYNTYNSYLLILCSHIPIITRYTFIYGMREREGGKQTDRRNACVCWVRSSVEVNWITADKLGGLCSTPIYGGSDNRVGLSSKLLSLIHI